MHRVLFVDDEPRILEGLENIMFPHTDDWDMEFALSGEEALQVLDRERCDVLVTDMRMPQMDGAELLEEVRTRYPGIVRIVLSGHSTFGAAKRALSIAHRFLSKPCDAATLVCVINEMLMLESLLEGCAFKEQLTRQDNLPARPSSFAKIQEVCANDDWALSDIVDIVAQDAAVATRVIQVANTAFFSRGTEVLSVAEAVPRIGARFIGELVLAFEVFGVFATTTSFDIEAMHDRGFRTGKIARALLDGTPAAPMAFVAGLVHEIGRLVMAVQLDGYLDLVGSKADVEREIAAFGTTHAEVGAYHLGLWGLPSPIVDAIAHQHAPDPDDGLDLTAAIFLAKELGAAMDERREPRIDPDLLTAFGFDDIEAVIQRSRISSELN